MIFPRAFAIHVARGGSFRASAGGQTVLTLERGRCQARTVWVDGGPRYRAGDAFSYALEGPDGDMILSVEPFRLRLYVDGRLEDEEWPQGYLPEGEWDVEGEYTLCDPPRDAETRSAFTGSAQFFCPPGRNAGAGDCMPFYRDGRYCVYYLFDRRGHRSKGGLGAHQWAQISSPDLRHWTIHPMAVGIDQMNEASICTGSLIERDGVISAFYAVRTTDGTPAQLTRADSRDGETFVKTGLSVTLSEPYEPVSARDPKVFRDEDGLYHMLVTTNLTGRRGGCLAHLTSSDLDTWTQREPFFVPGFADQPECSDYFKWGDTYYLVFSNCATARYRMSQSPFGPWTRPEYDLLDSMESAVCKTAEFGDRRLATGFLNRLPRSYAGNMITHELFRRPDGTLGSRFAPEFVPEYPLLAQGAETLGPGEYAEAGLGTGLSGIHLAARTKGDAWEWGVIFRKGDSEARLAFDAAGKSAYFLRPDQEISGPEWRNTIGNLPEMGGFELVMAGDILDVALSCGRTMTLRMAEKGPLDVLFYSRGGEERVEYILRGQGTH